MKKLIIIIFLANSMFLLCQKNTYVGIETSFTNDIFELTDYGDRLKSIPLITPVGLNGVIIGKEIAYNFGIETGFYWKKYSSGYGFITNSKFTHGFSSSSINAFQIPIKLRAKLDLLKDKIKLETAIAYHFCINDNYTSHGSGFSNSGNTIDTVSSNYASDSRFTKSFSLIETRIGLEFKLYKKLLLKLSASYYSGFRKIIELDINYTYNNSDLKYGKMHSNGNYTAITVGLQFQITDFWLWTKNKTNMLPKNK